MTSFALAQTPRFSRALDRRATLISDVRRGNHRARFTSRSLLPFWALAIACGGASSNGDIAEGHQAPPLAPFPQLEPSAEWQAPVSLIVRPSDPKLEEAFVRISDALARADMPGSAFYHVGAHGFAVTTPLEAIDDQGRPLAGPERWRLYPLPADEDAHVEMHEQQLAMGPAGRYRSFAILVAPEGARAGDASISGPDLLASVPAPGTRAIVQVFEYYRADEDSPPTRVRPSAVPAHAHVRAAGLWPGASEPQSLAHR